MFEIWSSHFVSATMETISKHFIRKPVVSCCQFKIYWGKKILPYHVEENRPSPNADLANQMNFLVAEATGTVLYMKATGELTFQCNFGFLRKSLPFFKSLNPCLMKICNILGVL